jgi:fermentation-respiration switch protein FrsA (DUF1100 family)
MVNKFAFYPDKDSSISRHRLPASAEELMITTSDGIQIQGIHFRRADKPGRLIIYFHGNAGNLYHRIDESVMLMKSGCDVLLIGYRGYGKSEGTPSETGIYRDGESALNYAAGTLGYKLNMISLYGRSLGTTVAVYTAQNCGLSRVILITPLSSGDDMAQVFTGSFLTSFIGGTFDSIGRINNIRVPILFIHGTSDEVVPYIQGKKLFDKFTGSKKMVTIPNGRHNDLEFTHPDIYWNSIFEFMK